MNNLLFRAYDLKKKEWIYPYPEPFHIIGEVTVFEMLKPYSIKNYNDIEITQYIGHKDKNEKMIFVGDIILHTYIHENKTIKLYQEIKYEWLEAGDDMDCESLGYHFNPSWKNNFIIVGNKFENKDLLK